MTLIEIKKMFTAGDIWEAVRVPGFGKEAESRSVRHIMKVRSQDYICTIPGKDGNCYGSLPVRKRDVIEARPGYLKFTVHNATITLTKH